jgi:iron complex outermembrane receptor protein
MRRSLVRISSILGLFFLLSAAPALAQQGTISGLVLDAETMEPISEAQITVLGAGDAQAGGMLSNAQGRFTVQLPAGSYSLVVQFLGFGQQRLDDVQVAPGATTPLEILLESTALQLNPIVVTASRRQEKALESPSNVVTIGAERIRERAAVSPVENVKALPGVDIVQSGLTSANVVTRGFNNVFSGALLVMTDNRYAAVPSLRFNAFNMLPPNQFDVERIEVLLGPAAAVYGPNSANGVMHIITTSPIDDPSSVISFAAGERSVFQSQFRTGVAFSERAGLKLSGSYFKGNDWQYRDPVELAAAEQPGANPLVASRDFDSERYGGEIRFDFRPDEDSELIVAAGANNLASNIELTGIGAGQARDWIYSFGQVRFTKDRTFAQAFINQSDAGETYFLRTGNPVVDKSRTIVGQVQQGFMLGDRIDVIGGVDLQFTQPRTEGTINGRNEENDEITEVGGYVQTEIALTDRIDFVGAARLDDHSELEDQVFSPRAALVFRPAENQNFRVSFNRAFSTPSTNNLFLDLVAGRIPLGGGIGYDVRTVGVPSDGFTFDAECPGGVSNLCMFSPFAPQGAGALPASAVPFWNGLVQAFVPAALQPALLNPGALPSDPALASLLRRFNQEQATFLPDLQGATDISRIAPTIYNNFEVGYKGLMTDRLLVSVDVYSQSIKDFVGPLRTETPSVFFDPATVQAFVTTRLGPLIAGGQVTPAQAASIIQGISSVPVGTISPDQLQSSDLLLTYRNFGDVDFWGTDLAFQFLATDQLSLSGSYSFVSKECFDFNDDGDCTSAVDISLNAPQNKGSFGVRWSDRLTGLTLEGRGRYVEEFVMNSGVYIGTVESYTVFDANIGYQLPFAPAATVTLTATNVFDNMHQEFVGSPDIGRLLLARLTYEF